MTGVFKWLIIKEKPTIRICETVSEVEKYVRGNNLVKIDLGDVDKLEDIVFTILENSRVEIVKCHVEVYETVIEFYEYPSWLSSRGYRNVVLKNAEVRVKSNMRSDIIDRLRGCILTSWWRYNEECRLSNRMIGEIGWMKK